MYLNCMYIHVTLTFDLRGKKGNTECMLCNLVLPFAVLSFLSNSESSLFLCLTAIISFSLISQVPSVSDAVTVLEQIISLLSCCRASGTCLESFCLCSVW